LPRIRREKGKGNGKTQIKEGRGDQERVPLQKKKRSFWHRKRKKILFVHREGMPGDPARGEESWWVLAELYRVCFPKNLRKRVPQGSG